MKQEEKNLQLQIRCLTTSVYDLQKVRIALGNRIVQSFYIQMGVEPSQKKETGDEESMKMIQKLMQEYTRVTDLMVENNFTIKKQLSNLPKDTTLDYIKSDLDYRMIKQYADILRNEEETSKILAKYVRQHPMWDRFFKDVRGCGELMAANCISYLDVDEARHVSSFWKYCGIDTVIEKDENGNVLFKEVGTSNKSARYIAKKNYTNKSTGNVYTGKVKATGEFDVNGEPLFTNKDGEILIEELITKIVDGEPVQVYVNIETGEEYTGEVTEVRHGRRKGDVTLKEYTDSDGNIQMKNSITYNPKLKTALLGVLSGCIIKTGQRFGYNKYEECYRDYKERLSNNPAHEDKSAAHRNKMAIRYMIKEFLRDLWVEWRTYEGYEISEPYEVAYLGRNPHKYNEAHAMRANKVEE